MVGFNRYLFKNNPYYGIGKMPSKTVRTLRKAGIDETKAFDDKWFIKNINIVKNADKEVLKKELAYGDPRFEALKEALSRVLKYKVEYVLTDSVYSSVAIVGIRNKETNRLVNYFTPTSTIFIKSDGERKEPIFAFGSIAIYGNIDYTLSPKHPIVKKDVRGILELLKNGLAFYGVTIFAYPDGDYIVIVSDIDEITKSVKVLFKVYAKINGKERSPFEKVITFTDFDIGSDISINSFLSDAMKEFPFSYIIFDKSKLMYSIPIAELPKSKLIKLVKLVGALRLRKRVGSIPNKFSMDCDGVGSIDTGKIDTGYSSEYKGIVPNSPSNYFKVMYGNGRMKLGFKLFIGSLRPSPYGVFGIDFTSVFVGIKATREAVSYDTVSGYLLRSGDGAKIYGFVVNGETLKVVPAVAEVVYSSEIKNLDKNKYCKFIREVRKKLINEKVLKEYERLIKELGSYTKIVPVWISELKGKQVIVIKTWDDLDVMDGSGSTLSIDFDPKSWEIKSITYHSSWVGDKANGISGYNRNIKNELRVKMPDVFVWLDEFHRHPEASGRPNTTEGFLYVKGKGVVRKLRSSEVDKLLSLRF